MRKQFKIHACQAPARLDLKPPSGRPHALPPPGEASPLPSQQPPASTQHFTVVNSRERRAEAAAAAAERVSSPPPQLRYFFFAPSARFPLKRRKEREGEMYFSRMKNAANFFSFSALSWRFTQLCSLPLVENRRKTKGFGDFLPFFSVH